MIKADGEQFKEVGIAQKLDMPCSPDKRVEVGAFNVEDNVDPADLTGLDLAKHVVDHLANDLFLWLILQQLLKYKTILLRTRRTERYVLVLRRTNKRELFEL